MKLRVRQRTARAALRAGLAGGVLIAGGAIHASLDARPVSWLYALTGPWSLTGFVIFCVACALVRMRLRTSPPVAGPALWLAIARYAVNIAFPLAAVILLPLWLAALIAGLVVAPSLLQALLLTLATFIMTTLSLGCALDLALLLAPKPEEPARR